MMVLTELPRVACSHEILSNKIVRKFVSCHSHNITTTTSSLGLYNDVLRIATNIV